MWCVDTKRFGVSFGILLILLWKTQAVRTTDSYGPTHVRTWTGWYDTDSPVTGGEDDERVTSIRKRGYQICNGLSPIDAMCRDVNQHAIMFRSDSTHVTDDSLVISCTTSGIMCRDSDQHNRTCRNYEIQFECLGAKDEAPPPNLGVIGVAAGLSVIVPIVCVAIMHVARLCRDRRNPRRRETLIPSHDNSEQSSQTDVSDLPPSYSFLFPNHSVSFRQSRHGGNADSSNNNSNNNSSVTVSLVAPVIDSSGNPNLAATRLSSGSISNLQDFHEAVVVVQPLSRADEESQQHHDQNSHAPRTSTWRSRLPNMHLSVFDLFMTSDRTSQHSTSVPPSPDPSYVQTPPPTYKEALVFLVGGKNVKESSENTKEDVDDASDPKEADPTN